MIKMEDEAHVSSGKEDLRESHNLEEASCLSSLSDSTVTDQEKERVLQEQDDQGADSNVPATKSVWNVLYNHRGALYSFLSSFFFAVQSVLIRYVQDDVHIMEVSFVRYVVMCVIFVPFLCYKKISIVPETRKICLLHLVRGSVGTAAFNCFYYAILFMKVGDATAIVHSSPVFVGIFARIFLKEAFQIVDILLVAVSILGVFLISQPPFIFGGSQSNSLSKEFIGSLFALTTSIGFALSNVTQSYMGKMRVNSSVILFYYGIIGALGTAGLTTFLGGWSYPPCFTARVVLLGIGVFHCAAQYLLTYSLSIEFAVLVAIIQTNAVLFAYLLEFVLFGATPELIASLGAILVMGASISVSLKKVPAIQKHCSSSPSQRQETSSLNAEPMETVV